MILAELDYELPADLIAQTPAEPRDSSRLLCLARTGGAIDDRRFAELPDLLQPGDVLIRNDTRVLPARTHFHRPTGGRLEVLFLEARGENADREEDSGSAGRDGARPEVGQLGGRVWQALVRGRPRVGETLTNCDRDGFDWTLRVVADLGAGRWLVESLATAPVAELLDGVGAMPLPPYIHADLDDPERYQTTFARWPGSAAAPTAGLHFTQSLDDRLATAGVEVVELTLHVGLGTFKALDEEMLAAGHLHSEGYVVDSAAWRRLLAAKAAGRRLVAVGTTMVRLLETLACDPAAAADRDSGTGGDNGGGSGSPTTQTSISGRTDLFIEPGFEFRLVGGMITNFHLPRTSLLALVMAFAGIAETRAAYEHAIAARYRFYSFGDAMLVL